MVKVYRDEEAARRVVSVVAYLDTGIQVVSREVTPWTPAPGEGERP